MLTNAEIWIAVLFCVRYKDLTAGNVNLQTVLCLLSADKILTKNMINVCCIFTCCRDTRFMWQVLSSSFVGSVSLMKNK